jgi:hypothetical protein
MERWEVLRIAERWHLSPVEIESTWTITDVWDATIYLDIQDDIARLPPRPRKPRT